MGLGRGGLILILYRLFIQILKSVPLKKLNEAGGDGYLIFVFLFFYTFYICFLYLN